MGDRWDRLADELVGGCQEAFVADLTAALADMLRRGVGNPDMFAVAARQSREAAMAVWAGWSGRVSRQAAEAFREALAEEDEEIVASLAAAHAPHAAADAGGWARNRVDEAARGMAQVLRRQNVAFVGTAADLWCDVTAEAVTRTLGGESRDEVMGRAVSRLAAEGLETVDYASGVRTSIDAAVRRHVVTQSNQCRNDLLMRRCDEYGVDLVFTSAHYGARPSHAVWQGRVFSRSGASGRYPGLAEATGYGTAGGLCGCNCRHTMTPYVEGLSKLPDTSFASQRERFGKTSDEYYEAVQRQRAAERRIRATKRQIAALAEDGLDTAALRATLGRQQAELRRLVADNGLTRDYSRERAYGLQGQPRALGLGTPGKSLLAFVESDEFKQAAKEAGVTQKEAKAALESHIDGLSAPFETLTPAKQSAALKTALKGLERKQLRQGATPEEALAYVCSDAQPKKVEVGKQNQHINGTKEWRDRCEKQGGAVQQSEVALTIEEIQALVYEYAGTGEMHVTGANPPQLREVVIVKGRIIGTWRDRAGNSSETDSLAIHYSKKGAHVVPAKPSWRRADD